MALKSAILAFCLEARQSPLLAAHAPAHPDELPPGSEGVSLPRPCELVEGTIIRSCCSLCPRCHGVTGGGFGPLYVQY